jgi:His-Xaa-Ser system radical SAM maturase HxsB
LSALEPTTYKSFKPIENYEKTFEYELFYFNFRNLGEKYILINDTGEYVLCSLFQLRRLIAKELTYEADNAYILELLNKQFIYLKSDTFAVERKSIKYRTKKRFLFSGPILHIFVVTTRCQHKCLYCQITPQSETAKDFDMTVETARRAVEMMMQSPSQHITAEFQGGETLLAFDIVKEIVLYTEQLNEALQKEIQFVMATSLVDINLEQLDFIKEHKILLSTSLDGDEALHNSNRPIRSQNTHKKFIEGMTLARGVIGGSSVSPLLTTSKASLSKLPIIISEYLKHGYHSISLRSLSPYGFAVKTFSTIGYTLDEFLDFYFEGLEYIIKLNKEGTYFREEFITLLLKRILTPYSTGYVDLQSPSGAGVNAIAYHYNGEVYPADEARMLAEMGDKNFCLGNVYDNSFDEIFQSKQLELIIQDSCAESLNGCSDCAYLPYCGADPLFNYVKQNDHYGHRPTSDFCKRQTRLFDYLFSVLESDDQETIDIFWSWVNSTPTINKNIIEKKEEKVC